MIAQGHGRAVVGAQLVALVGRLVHAPVRRPIEHRPAVRRRIVGAERRRRVERLVRVERFDVQQPVVGVSVLREEVEPVVEAPDRREVAVLANELAVDDVLRVLVAPAFVDLQRVVHLAQPFPRRRHHRLPRIALLAADELERVVAVVVGGPAVLPVVIVVGHEVRIHAAAVQHLGERIVERLQWTPRSVQERQASGVHVATCRHARQAADVMRVERHRARREPLEVRRPHRTTAVRRQRRAVERVEQDEYESHAASRAPVSRSNRWIASAGTSSATLSPAASGRPRGSWQQIDRPPTST